MKKVFLAVALTTLLLCNANAQNSEIEAAMQETKAEQFLKENSFVREDQITSYVGKGLEVYAKIFTDLTSGQRIAALEFYTQNQVAAGTAMNIAASLASDGKSAQVVSEEDMAAKPLGYLDMDNVQDLITALENIVLTANNASKKDVFSISYTAPGGIDVYFSQGIKDMWGIKGDASVVFRKKWYGINEYGVRSVQYTRTKGIKIENIAKLIPIIKDAKIIAEKELNASYTSQMQVVPFKPIQHIQTSSTDFENTINESEVTPKQEVIAKKAKPEKPQELSDTRKKEVTTHMIQVQQEYTKLELTFTPIFTAYKKVVSQLMMSRVLEDWKTLDAISALMENLLKADCTIDKTALEKQLAEKTTPAEMIEVFKAFLQ